VVAEKIFLVHVLNLICFLIFPFAFPERAVLVSQNFILEIPPGERFFKSVNI